MIPEHVKATLIWALKCARYEANRFVLHDVSEEFHSDIEEAEDFLNNDLPPELALVDANL